MLFLDNIKLQLYIKKLELTKKKRNHSVVDTDWDKGVWNRKYEDIDFESPVGAIHVDNESSIFVKNGKMFKGKYSEYVEKYEKQILDILSKHLTNENLVELGCGLGRHLFQLYKRKFENLQGYDISTNAISLAKTHSEKKGYKIKFDVLDLTEPFPDGIIKDKAVFTHACLEQTKHHIPDILKNIINGKPKLIINFEVDYESSPSIVKRYIDALDYQNNLVSELKKLEKENKIEVICIEKLPLSLSPVNRLSVIVWKIK